MEIITVHFINGNAVKFRGTNVFVSKDGDSSATILNDFDVIAHINWREVLYVTQEGE